MWMSELSARSGVAVPTVKYYLREGLLHPGKWAGATRAVYDESHVRRLRLIRALVGVGGMGLDHVREVLEAVDDDSTETLAAVGAAHLQLSPPPPTPPSEAARERVAALIRARRWRTDPDGSHSVALAAALDALDGAGQPLRDRNLEVYADAAASVARADLAGTPRASAEGATTYAVIGTVLSEPVLLALRRMAQEHLARRRLARSG